MASNISISADIDLDLPLAFSHLDPSGVDVHVVEAAGGMTGTSKEIEAVRDGYRPAARRGAVLFFVLSEMAAINSMYQYSLSSYLEVSEGFMLMLYDSLCVLLTSQQVFDHSLRRSLPDTHLQKRLNNIINTLSLNVYNYACTGMHLTVGSIARCLS